MTALTELTGQNAASETRMISEKNSPKVAELEAKGHSIYYTSAILDLLWGEYDSALEKSQHALQGMRKQLGRKHFKTLGSASLEAFVLAIKSQYQEAETRCKEILPAMTQELGREHPLTLDTMACLVYIFRAQARFAEALDTAKSLYKITRDALKEDHPQTLRVRSQLAAAHWSLGEYSSAEQEIQAIVKLSEETCGDFSPDTLRYKSEKANVLCSLGKIDEARNLALEVLRSQRHLYSLSQEKDEQPLPVSDALPPNIEANGNILLKTIDDIRYNGKKFVVHPSLIFTLQVLALIEMHNPRSESEISLPQRILETVVSQRETKLGPAHALTLMSKYELALVVRENDTDGKGLVKASKEFRHVLEERVKLFGKQHPEVMSVERELIITDCIRGVWEDGGPAKRARKEKHYSQIERTPSVLSLQKLDGKDESILPSNLTFEQWSDVENVSFDILHHQEHQLGKYHPETLKSFIWLFIVQLLLHKKRRTDISSPLRDILNRLRHPTVRRERLVEVLRMEEKVALILTEQGHHERAMGVLHEIIEAIEDKNSIADPSMEGIIDSINSDVKQALVDLNPYVKKYFEKLQTLSDQGDQEYKSSEFIEAERTRTRVSESSRRLYGNKDGRTLTSQFKLALAKWATKDKAKQREAVEIISWLHKLDTNLLETELKQDVEDKHYIWTQEFSKLDVDKAGKEQGIEDAFTVHATLD